MQKAGQEAEAAEREVYEGVGAAETLFYPDCSCVSMPWIDEREVAVGRWREWWEVGVSRTSDRWEQHREEHEEAVCAAHVVGFRVCRWWMSVR